MPLETETRKPYALPKLSKLTTEQAKLLLLGHAIRGEQGAKDLLDALYPPCGSRHCPDVVAQPEKEKLTETLSGASGLIRRVSMALQSTREDFRRFVRG